MKIHHLDILLKTTGALINQQKCIDSLYLRIDELEMRLNEKDKKVGLIGFKNLDFEN